MCPRNNKKRGCGECVDSTNCNNEKMALEKREVEICASHQADGAGNDSPQGYQSELVRHSIVLACTRFPGEVEEKVAFSKG